MDSTAGRVPEETESQKPSDPIIPDLSVENTIVPIETADTPNTSDKTNQTTLLSRPDELVKLSEPTEEQTEVDIAPIDYRGVLHNTYLIKMIIPHLQSEPQALAKIMTVCKFFNKVGRKVLWEHADPRELIPCAPDRQAKYACLIKHVKFFEHAAMWPAPVLSCPQLPNILSLQIDNTSLFASNSQQLRLFLSSDLRELCIWTALGQANQISDPREDITWLSHLGATCVKLEVLQLEVALDVSPAELTSFFDGMPQLKTLCLGPAFDNLDKDAPPAILTLPHTSGRIQDGPVV